MAANGGGGAGAGGDVQVTVDDAALRKAYTQSELRYLKIQVRARLSLFGWELRIGGRRSGGSGCLSVVWFGFQDGQCGA